MVPLWLACLPLALAQQSSLSASSSALASSSSLSESASSSVVPTSVSASTSVAPTSADSTSAAPSSWPSVPTQPRVHVPIKQYSFTPFPTPSQSSVPGLFPDTDPSSPPSVGAAVIPNFQPAWNAAFEKAKTKIAGFTLEEKVNVTTGSGWQKGPCVGNIAAIEPRDGRGWPGLCLQDSPLGVRLVDYATAFPAGINAAATWNRELIRARGVAMGKEHRGKGVNIALGPMMNLGRVVQGGRNWEGFGADPFLTGEAAYETILGMQQEGVQACAKHLILNEQEHKRTSSSSNADDRTIHEVYAHPFLRSIQAGVTSMMCSYNLINGTYACENDRMMNEIIKDNYGFQGFIMSDWQGTMSTISPITGLDMNMPGDIFLLLEGDSAATGSWWGQNLTSYVQNDTIPEARLDDMATRILAAWYLLGQDSPDYPATNFDSFDPLDDSINAHIDVQDDHADLVRTIGAASTVLLKNKDSALPLTGKERSIFLAGSDAGPPSIGPNRFANQQGLEDGVLAMGWGSGTANFTYLISPYEAIQQRARKHRTSLSWSFDDFNLTVAGNMAIAKDVALVFIAADSGEGALSYVAPNPIEPNQDGDRLNLTAWHSGEDLILAVAEQNDNTIVVVNSVGPLIVESWIDHPNVTAVLWAGLQGSETGNAITDVLYGDWNPSGRLPYTIAKSVEDYSAHLVVGGGPDDIISVDYTEGLEIDYRHFDANNIEPRFEFGFGLSYTEWEYSDLTVTAVESSEGSNPELEDAWAQGKATPLEFGASTALWLHRPAFNVTFNVQNTGDRYGGEIPQLYLNMPSSSGEPPSLLKGFTDIAAAPGETRTVSILLSRYDASIWDTEAQGWRRPDDEIGITVGRSSRDGKLVGKLPL